MDFDAALIGGRERRRIVIVEYDPGWPGRHERERQRVACALGPVALRIEHIGSTAVPGLAAGYELRVREPGHRMFQDACLRRACARMEQ